MWLHVDDVELAIIKQALSRKHGYHIVSCQIDEAKQVQALQDKIKASELSASPDDELYRSAVKVNDRLEVDADAIVSYSDAPGAWIHTWTWVSATEAGIVEEENE